MKNRITLFILVSLLLHLLLSFLFWMGKDRLVQKTVAPPAVWVELKTLKDFPIADIPKPAKEEKPEKARAESLYNLKAKEETVAVSQPKSPSPQPPPIKGGGEKNFPSPLGGDAVVSPSNQGQGEGKIPGMPEMTPLASNDDFLPDYKLGNRTYINALANPNIGYFVELKRKYRLTWNPAPSLRGQAHEISRGKIDVVLGVSVNDRGELVDLVVLRSSGLAGYDSEGKRTIRDSAPYSSPPANLVKEDGLLHMAWTFVVYL